MTIRALFLTAGFAISATPAMAKNCHWWSLSAVLEQEQAEWELEQAARRRLGRQADEPEQIREDAERKRDDLNEAQREAEWKRICEVTIYTDKDGITHYHYGKACPNGALPSRH